jgi:hypothetical protein
MARALRHDDPRCGREHFDARAGLDWECGPDPNDITGSIPDVPWNKYKHTLERPNRLLYENHHWAVTVSGLEPLYSTGLDISASNLLRMHDSNRVYFWPVTAAEMQLAHFGAFEDAFRHALRFHCYERGLAVDGGMLDTSFRRARAIARKPGRRATDDKFHERNLRGSLRSEHTAIVRVERITHPAIDGSREIWLQFPSHNGVRCLPRLPNQNDRRVLSAAYPFFFREWFDGPREVFCTAEWASNEWFLLTASPPRPN